MAMMNGINSKALVKVLAVLVLGIGSGARSEGEEIKVAWSVWTGWMPFKLIEDQGFLKKRAESLGVDVRLVEFKGYMDSVQAFAAGKVDACAMTSMEALQPASSGIPTTAVIVNDISHGGDGLLLRNGMEIADIKGQKVLLEQFSVSHYLLNRALEINGLSEKDVRVVNIPGDDAGKAFLTDDSVKAVATWNPHLFLASESGKGKVVFSSQDIPNEIIDLLVFNSKVINENRLAVEAVVLAWFDAMAMIENKSTRPQAVRIMAEGAGASVEEFEKMLGGTRLFTNPEMTSKFFNSNKLQSTMSRIRNFSYGNGLITDKDFKFGFPEKLDGLLNFDPSFVGSEKIQPQGSKP